MSKLYSFILYFVCLCFTLFFIPSAFSQSAQDQDLGYAITVDVIRAQAPTTTTTTTASPSTTITATATATEAETTTTTTEEATPAPTETTTATEAGGVGGEILPGDFTYIFGIIGVVVVGVLVYFMWSRGWHL